ncbi:protein-tyrosine-phosphatase [Burkholderia sp. BCC1999]|uniref:arsenate reductase/protein-tyrosine-phosphatase family protein n=1 Tax=Burkholderia sp. BCC1999 TaxID=2817448 RepID=UPI002AC337D5|nr:protein-tyrosine-phosphatase [Burkholderia sp. BCC1999]
MNRLLLVCTANVCRSPMAEVLFRRVLDGVRVMSAGVDAMPGMGADPAAIAVMRRIGLDLGQHRSQPLARWMIESSALVLTMSERQRQVIAHRYPSLSGRVCRLLPDEDVADPYRLDSTAYAATVERLTTGVRHWSGWLADVTRHTQTLQETTHEPS